MPNTTDRPVAIVTAASRGMGEAIARELARRNYRMALLARSESVLELAQELGGVALQGSVSDAADLERLVALALDSYGRIDVVANNTGHPPTGPLLDIADADWHVGLDMVVLNIVRMSRLVTPHMVAAGGGAIVNISTIGATQPDARFPVSAVLRAGLANFAKLFAERYAAENVRMNNVLPGRIDSYPQPPERIADIPAKRLGRVGEIAEVVAFLASDAASYINGQSLIVDGGLVRGT
ncbi:oxidoreductase/short-chain dehydrogenase [Aliidongia dinghuensis]|uniref:Oxidoreductase/short-chain dehydrogenase n=1 Tax=Aliidongia dinghuensis TaxID=1867774 RepID=A0A8J3E7T5_9PROT|nr:SDR family oxidoreductase [Aliidongia dinghuensis]GGF49213.1 oxidoreductase/short-chain dehydrogenase [Aliidongia dinghuensis]